MEDGKSKIIVVDSDRVSKCVVYPKTLLIDDIKNAYLQDSSFDTQHFYPHWGVNGSSTEVFSPNKNNFK